MTEFDRTEAKADEIVVKNNKAKTHLSRLDKMKTFVRLPSRLPQKDPEWMIKGFRRESLLSEEIEDYMKWKHEFKLSRFAKIIKGVHIGTLIKVNHEVASKKV